MKIKIFKILTATLHEKFNRSRISANHENMSAHNSISFSWVQALYRRISDQLNFPYKIANKILKILIFIETGLIVRAFVTTLTFIKGTEFDAVGL
jgi:hypothetical protein